jgi:hypothetical protein
MIELIQSQLIPTSKLLLNSGQLEGVPKNPRFIKDERYTKLIRSIQDDPEMLGARELLVYAYDGKYIVLGGNMRLRACKELGIKEVPCKVLPELTPDKLRSIVIKDNVAFGSDDFDMLANDWDIVELVEWGMEIPSLNIEVEELTDSFDLKDGDREPFQQITFTLADEQAIQIKNAIDEIKKTEEFKYCETLGNENGNGNALYLIIMQWAEQKTSF